MGMHFFIVFSLFIVFTTLVENIEGKRVAICQGDRQTISCKKNRRLQILTATYGLRRTRNKCHNANVAVSWCGKTNNAKNKVIKLCQSKQDCELFSSNRVFKDPCPGTSVILTVVFRCVRGCNKNKFQCVVDLKCIPKSKRCNGKKDCKDGSDEDNCSTVQCKSNEFKCKNGEKCIPLAKKCDGYKDCSDNSDELANCPLACKSNQFKCKDGEKCIPLAKKCDGYKDCSDNSDELANCPLKCKTNEFKCNDGKKCIPNNRKCNGNKDCSDGSDEAGTICARESCGVQQIKPKVERVDCPKRKLWRLVGGCDVRPPHSWPWAVQLRLLDADTNTFNHECGAALLSESYALTASHCFLSSDNPKDWKAIGGRHLKDKNEANNQPRNVVKILKFPNDGDNILDKDVAIIKFDKPMTINDYVTPICLPTREPTVNDECVVVGWGDVQETEHPDKLKNTVMPIVDTKRCNGTEDLKDQITPYMFCAGFQEGKNDACQGDSGGPLMCEIGNTWYLQGLVSWGVDCAQPLLPGVYANVFKFVGWIRNQMKL
ncbi:suppressor of tumorigenicity 14 protein homolog [Mytilus trossulus]|uniref:suppressor of tumorigenicity 14 protein homolog n=1 Tax=Mytilus trossulus TaxID=6551 RepID=UPI003006ACED